MASRKIQNSKINQWIVSNQVYLADYSSFKWYFLKQVHDYNLIASILPCLSTEPTDFSKHDDEAFELWNQSELRTFYLKP